MVKSLLSRICTEHLQLKQQIHNVIKIQAKDLIDTSAKKIYKWPGEPMERCSTPTVIREVQVKPTVRCPFTPRTARIRKKKYRPGWCDSPSEHRPGQWVWYLVAAPTRGN